LPDDENRAYHKKEAIPKPQVLVSFASQGQQPLKSAVSQGLKAPALAEGGSSLELKSQKLHGFLP
jgi:hypothetical protein